jgi:hypothetical protein
MANQYLKDGLSPSEAADVLRLFDTRISYDNRNAVLRIMTRSNHEHTIVLEALSALLAKEDFNYGVGPESISVTKDIALAAGSALCAHQVIFKGIETLPGEAWRAATESDRPGFLRRIFSRRESSSNTDEQTR